MPVNTVLQFAIDNEMYARGILMADLRLRGADVDDLSQEVFLRILRADPQNVECPKAYWLVTVRSVVTESRRRGWRPVLHLDESVEGDWLADPKQDHVTGYEAREEIATALSLSTAAERETLIRLLTQPPRSQRESGADRVRIHRFRRRLQGAMA